MRYNPVKNFINGGFVAAETSRFLNVVSPLDGESLSKAPLSTSSDLNRAVAALRFCSLLV